MTNSLKSVGFVCLFTMSMLTVANAEVLDQEYDFAPDAEGTIRSNFDRAQTFTVGVTGTLTRLELRLRRFTESTRSPLLVDIRSTLSGVPVELNSPVLASATIAAESLPIGSISNAPFASIDFNAANLAVSMGDVLAIVLRSNDQYEWMKANSGGYSGGSEFTRSTQFPTWNVGSLDEDFAFRTYVVPEPATVALLVLGGIAAAPSFVRRQRRHVHGVCLLNSFCLQLAVIRYVRCLVAANG